MITKNKLNILLVSLTIAGIVLSLVGLSFVSQAAPEPMARKIVVFKPEVTEANRQALLEKFGGSKLKNLDLINGQAVLLPASIQAVLAGQPEVLRIEEDVRVYALENPIADSILDSVEALRDSIDISAIFRIQASSEKLPWGINRIDAELVWDITTGDPIKVAIIDTGIDRKHPDLQANLKGGVSTVWYTSNYNDDNGHGTHVAGIVAAIDNNIGVVGVGPKIDLYAVKVLDRWGSGYLSDIIEGLEWAINNHIQVINMSLGTTANIDSFHVAIQRAQTAGIVLVAAAGNDGKAVNYPAAYSEVIAVSATDSADNLASWSSRGPQVDLAAPGVSIYSTYRNSKYATMSGTSMATPHVTGTAALVLDRFGALTPADVQQKLEATAEDLGTVGRDDLYGAGLVDAEAAVQ